MNARRSFPTFWRKAFSVVIGLAALGTAFAQEPTSADELRVTTGVAGVFDHERDSHVRIEYHFDKKLILDIRPFLTIGHYGDGAFHVGAGLEYTCDVTKDWRFTLASGPVYYQQNHGTDLGNTLEFVSYAEIATEVRPRLWIGANIAHISNANLGPYNPGREMIGLSVSFSDK